MERIVLFRFHRNSAICLNRLQQIKKLNSEIAIFGLYGGKPEDTEGIQETLRSEFVDIFSIADKPDDWKWKNSDLAVRLWYKEVGKHVDFDMVHLLEWDLLLCDSLDSLYAHIPDGIGMTGLVPLSTVADRWDWITEMPQKLEWEKLLDIAKNKFNYHDKPFACLGPGTCFSRTFLDKYAATDVPEIGHDELRLPLFCQILKEPMYDTGFYKKWFYAPERTYFNCRNEEILLKTIQEELQKKEGRRVFHPVRQVFTFL